MPVLSILFATVFYSAYALFASRAAGRIDPWLSSGITNGIAAIFQVALYYFLFRARGVVEGALAPAPLLPGGLLFSVLAGMAIAGFGVFLMKAFAGGGVSYVIPMVYGGTIALASLVGWAAFRESIAPVQALGIVVVLCGLGLIVFAKMKVSAP